MVLILSQKDDFTTNLIQDWLYYYKKTFKRVNGYFHDISFHNEGVLLKSKEGEKEISVNINEITSYWYRRGRVLKDIFTNNPILNSENNITEEYISYLLESKKSIGSFRTVDLNKLISLEIAKKTGLNIPDTYILETKNDVLNLLRNNRGKEYVTKMKTSTSIIKFDDTTRMAYTNLLTEDQANKFPNKFLPSLIQERIDKLFEIRTFYLNGKVWSMAIFSQQDEQTKIDYRKYNHIKPNRNTPFKLPKDIEDKLCLVMDSLNLNTGSIDWILDKNNNFYFLEINPVGQFNNVSVMCNYHLEKIIAEEL